MAFHLFVHSICANLLETFKCYTLRIGSIFNYASFWFFFFKCLMPFIAILHIIFICIRTIYPTEFLIFRAEKKSIDPRPFLWQIQYKFNSFFYMYIQSFNTMAIHCNIKIEMVMCVSIVENVCTFKWDENISMINVDECF